MIEVQVYHDQDNDRWNGYVVSVTTRTEQEMKNAIVSEFNRVTGESKTEADFQFGQA